jgi:hypothetical protein
MIKQDNYQEQEPEILDEATVQAINSGLKSEENGHFLTMDEAVQFAKKRRKEWQTVQPVDTATA